MTLNQGQRLRADSDFTFRVPGSRGRSVTVKKGDMFVVTSPAHNNGDCVIIDRDRRAKLNQGYLFTRVALDHLFTLAEESNGADSGA